MISCPRMPPTTSPRAEGPGVGSVALLLAFTCCGWLESCGSAPERESGSPDDNTYAESADSPNPQMPAESSNAVGEGSSNVGDSGVARTVGQPTAPGAYADDAGVQQEDTHAPVDPPYANVTAVSASGSDGMYTLSVSVESSDVDCTQYTDWWEVVNDAGELLYRRILTHSHTEENGTTDPDAPGNTFTRSGGPVAVTGEQALIVRAHINSSATSFTGYNGKVMSGSVSSGFFQAPDLGPDFAPQVETESPQPDGCSF
jgi:hypothetical protein